VTDILKVLDQGDPAAVTPTLFYTVPELSSTTVSSLVVCNRTSSSETFRVSVRKSGDGADDSQYLFYDVPLYGNSTLTAVLGLTLAEADAVWIYASALGLSFNLFGVETK
jgi:hypothetical protein